MLEQRIRHLLMKLHSRDRGARNTAIGELEQLERPLALEMLQSLLLDPDGNVRADAALGLLLIDPGVGVAMVLPLLADPEVFVRWYVCGLFHDFGDQRAAEQLTKVILADPDPGVRHTACYALEEIGDSQALPALRWVQENDKGEDYEGRTVAMEAALAIESILDRKK